MRKDDSMQIDIVLYPGLTALNATEVRAYPVIAWQQALKGFRRRKETA